MEGKEVYKESQRFNQIWFWGILAFSGAVILYRFWIQYAPSNFQSLTLKPVFSILLFFLIVILLVVLRLDIMIDNQGISYKWFPFRRTYKTIEWNKIESLRLRRYGAIAEFGGYGMRYTFRTTAFIVSGNDGIEIVQKGKKRKFLLGITNPGAAQQIINKYSPIVTA